VSSIGMVPITQSERDQFRSMAVQYFSELNESFTPHRDWEQHYFETIQAATNIFLRWIVSDGERAGFILFGIEKHRFLPRNSGRVYELYVTPAFRGRGIARACAAQAIKELWELGPSKIELEVVEGNAKARGLWKSMGFRKASERFVLRDGAS